MRRLALLILALVGIAGLAAPGAAHEVRPAYLDIVETQPRHFTIFWKQPAQGEIALRLVPRLSNGWLDGKAQEVAADPGQLAKRWQAVATRDDALEGVRLTIEGLDTSITDVMVAASLADGRRIETIVRPRAPSIPLRFGDRGRIPVPAYLRLGIEHILSGVDHLSFVLGLLLLIGLRWRLVKAITAFTVAHSITLAASALGAVRPPAATIEVLVALSILFLAVELVRAARGEGGIALRHPWIVAFAFGLLHGFAFAGVLAEIGLPRARALPALLLFNLGVEIGQLVFVAAAALVMVAATAIARRWPSSLAERIPARLLPGYVIGGFAGFWFIERLMIAVA